MTTLRLGSLCSGYGGLDLAVHDVLGAELAWVADNDPGAASILAHRFPRTPNLGDLTAVNWAEVEPVDVLCAGFPCQDVSAAGKRAGLRPGTRSGVWLRIVDGIRCLRPRLVVIENVRGLLTARGDEPAAEHLAAEAARDAAEQLLLWLDNEHDLAIFKGDTARAARCQARTARLMGLHKRSVARCRWHERRLVRAIGTVLGTLADLGYDARWQVVSAADVGAPHRRERVFIVARAAADAERDGRPGRHTGAARAADERGEGSRATAARRGTGAAADADGGQFQRRRVTGIVGSATPGEPGQGDQRERPGHAAVDGRATAADPERDGREGQRCVAGQATARPHPGTGRRRPAGSCLAAADAERQGLEGRTGRGEPAERRPSGEPASDAQGASWGTYAAAIGRWEAISGRAAPAATELGPSGQRLSPRFVEWMMGLPDGWVTDVPGLPRNAQLRALGNGVVPLQAAEALRRLLAADGLEVLA